MKTCITCKRVKNESEFHKDRSRKEGLSPRCKPCACAQTKRYYRSNSGVWRRLSTETKRRGNRRYNAKHPGRLRAHRIVDGELRSGRMKRGECERLSADCSGKVHAHHDDYAKPVEVRWLCARHHREWHKENGPGLNA